MSALFATTPEPTSRRAAARPAVLLTALVCIAAHASSFAHLVAVRHVSCPSHAEEMVHAPGVAPPVAPPPPAESSIDAWSVGSAVGGVEDHCLAVGLDRRATPVSAPVVPPAPAPRLEPPFLCAGTPAVPSEALFRLAPKTSPPLPGPRRA